MVKKKTDVKLPQIILEIKEENLTSNGGAGVLFNAAERKWRFDKNLKKISVKKRNSGYSDLCYSISLIANFISGGYGLNSLDVLEMDENFRKIIGLEGVPDPSSAGEYLRAFSDEALDCLNEESIKIVKKIFNSLKKNTYTYGDWLYGFVDGSLLEVSGNKREGTETRDRNGNRSLLFMPFYHDDFLANVKVAGGNCHESTFFSDLVKPYEAMLKKHKVHFFLDSAFYSQSIVEEVLDRNNYFYTMTVNKATDPLRQTAEELKKDQWRLVNSKKYFNGKYEKIEVGEISYCPGTWFNEHRFVVSRCMKKGEFFPYYHFVLTNRNDLAPKEVLDLHLAKGGEENKHKNLLCDMNLHHPPMQKLSANQAYYTYAMIAHNIIQPKLSPPSPAAVLVITLP